MYLLPLIAVIGLKTLLCKGVAIGILLFVFWVKGRKLRFHPDQWDRFFLFLPAVKVQQYAVWIYLAAALISSGISYVLLGWTRYRHRFGITALIFIGGLAITAYKLYTKGRYDLLNRYQESPKAICLKREEEENA